MSKKNFSTLKDIENFLVYTPPIFIIILSIIAMIVTTFIINNKQQNVIEMKIVSYQHLEQTLVKDFVEEINDRVTSKFDKSEKILNKSVSEVSGYIKSLQLNKSTKIFEKVLPFAKSIEKEYGVDFVFIDTNKYEILRGEEIISYLQHLTNAKIDSQTFKQHILKNLDYISNQNLQYWIDINKRQMQLSYFEKIKDSDILYGAFSKIGDMKYLFKDEILESIPIKTRSNEYGYFWFYDYDNGYLYNYNNKNFAQVIDEIRNPDDVLKTDANFEKFSNVYDIKKYQFLVGINSYKINNILQKDIEKIKQKYSDIATSAMITIIFITLILIVLLIIFVKYISKIFQRYNRRLEYKNLLHKKWKDRYELAIIASNDGLWDIDFTNNRIYFSKKWLDMLGYKSGEVSSFDEWMELIHPSDRESVNIEFDKHLKGVSKNFICEYRIRTKNGKYNWMLARGKFFNSGSHKDRMLMMSMDINDMKKLSTELEEKVKIEVEKNREKDRMLVQQNKLASMGEMIGSIAHQWRQPLNNINLLVHFTRDNFYNKSFKKENLDEVISDIKLQIDYMSKTIDDFRNFYKSDKERVSFNIKSSILKTINILSSQFENSKTSYELIGDEVFINSFENEFGQVILNILNNAIDAGILKSKYESFIPKISIVVIKEDNGAKIEFINNCGNIEKDTMERIFEPYFTTKFENQGTGIGLYMSKTIIEKSMNGKISAENYQDGVKFVILLPL